MKRTSATVAQVRTDQTLMQAFFDAASQDTESRLIISSESRPVDIDLPSVVQRGIVIGSQMRHLGIGTGDVVAIQLPNCIEWILTTVAVAFTGATLLPIVPIYGPNELHFILNESGARLLITPVNTSKGVCYERVLEAARPPPGLQYHVVVGSDPSSGGAIAWQSLERPMEVTAPARGSPDDVAMIFYTSGTTAQPKGVQHTHRTLLAELTSLFAVRPALRSGAFLSPWPTGHVSGAGSVLRFLAGGVTTVMLEQWHAKTAAALVEQYRVMCCSGTPFHLTGLLDAAQADNLNISSLTDYQTGAAPVSSALIARCAEHGLATYRSYGSTEHPTVTFGSAEDPIEKRLHTEGRLVPGCVVRFVDDEGVDVPSGEEGEIVSSGPELFAGYKRSELDQDAFLLGGWYRSGDIGRMDEDGYLLITDRKKDIIIRGGENISSREVEDHLVFHPAIAEAAVIAAADVRMGEVVCAVLVLRTGHEISIPEIAAFFAQRGVARQKTPERLLIIDEMPRNATGKILKNELRVLQRRSDDGQVAATSLARDNLI